MVLFLRSAGIPTVRGVARGAALERGAALVRGAAQTLVAAICLLFGLVAVPPGQLAAADATGDKPGIWLVTIGGWAVLEPSFEGARDFAFGGRPIFAFRRDGAKDWLTLPKDGFDIDLFETDRFRAGPVASWHWQRSAGTVPRGFQQVGKIDLSLEAGGFLEYWPSDALRSRLEVRQSVVGGRGLVADLSIDAIWRPDRAILVTGGPRLSVADTDFMRASYGIDGAQSVVLGVPAHAAQAGIRSYGAGSMLKYFWSEQWATMTFIEYARLAGDASDSPVIGAHNGTKDQVTAGVGTTFTFSVGR